MSRWSNYFMDIAKRSAEMSKDPKTKVGAVIIQNRRIKSVGFNGAPQSFPDSLVPFNINGESLLEQKNTFMCHAELNAVLNYDGKISDLKDADIYVTVSPCSKCACMLAQVGIKRVIYKEEYRRKEEVEATKYILEKCNVQYIKFDDLGGD